MLDKLVIGMSLSADEFIANLRPLINAKKEQLAKSEYARIAPNMAESDNA
jgi:hypothetical protein